MVYVKRTTRLVVKVKRTQNVQVRSNARQACSHLPLLVEACLYDKVYSSTYGLAEANSESTIKRLQPLAASSQHN